MTDSNKAVRGGLTSGSALSDALAMIALGPQRGADAAQWFRVSIEMCKHCKGTENVNEAAARIVKEAHAVLSDFARTAPGRLPSSVQDALAPQRPNAKTKGPPTAPET